jgi:hypothetical protein
LIRLLGILQIIHIFKNKANKAKPKHQIGIWNMIDYSE